MRYRMKNIIPMNLIKKIYLEAEQQKGMSFYASISEFIFFNG